MLKEDENILVEGAQKIGIELNKAYLGGFSQYLDLLIKWNQKINLTSLKTSSEIITKHFLDSIACIKVINQYIHLEEINIIDVGTGAGFPGIPIKIAYPSIKLSLLEAKKKKIIFLEKLIEKLNLKNVKILNGRAETFGRCSDYREKYDLVISRAVAPLNILSEYCLPLVRIGGLFIAQKGRSYKEETEKGINTINFLGGELIKVENIQIPFIKQERYILVIRKIKDTPLGYPRREGVPQKRPLYF